jgi:hypothetical protein
MRRSWCCDFNGEQILAWERDGNSPVVPKPLTSGAKFEGRFDKRGFVCTGTGHRIAAAVI